MYKHLNQTNYENSVFKKKSQKTGRSKICQYKTMMRLGLV